MSEAPRPPRIEGTSLARQLLCAVPQLLDPNFVRSVVLIVDHSREGAFGLVLNHRLPTPLAEMAAAIGLRWAGDLEQTVGLGGPVEPSRGFILHDQPGWDPLAEAITPGVLTAWYQKYCSMFEVRPFNGASATAEQMAEAKAECDTTLYMLSEAGAIWRYGVEGAAQPDHRARLERELKILADKAISAYFLIVWDFVNWGRQNGVPARARGSGVGTMVGYVLALSNACPVRYGLLFERFTDPDRSEYPDIDIDLCQDGRQRVINYVRTKYGHVAQIITFGTLKARAAIRDVGRVFELPLPEVDKIAKLIPEALGTTLDDALASEPDLKNLYDRDPQVKRILDTARTLEGQARHASVHAAGVIVAARPLHEVVPLYKPSGAAENDVVDVRDGRLPRHQG